MWFATTMKIDTSQTKQLVVLPKALSWGNKAGKRKMRDFGFSASIVSNERIILISTNIQSAFKATC